jgi:hypothetical protein
MFRDAVRLVDPSGDAYYNCPHLYVEFSATSGPFSGFRTRLSVKDKEIQLDDSWKRIDFFPKTISRSGVKHRIHRTKKVSLDPETLKGFLDYSFNLDTLYAVDNRFDFLRPHDIIAVSDSSHQPGEPGRLLEIRHIQKGPFLEYLKDHVRAYSIRLAAQRQIGRTPLTTLTRRFVAVKASRPTPMQRPTRWKRRSTFLPSN